MANARNADFTLLDFTDEISLFPKVWDLVSGMDLFVEHNIETTVAQIEFVKESITDIAACTRGSSRNTAGTNTATVVNLNVPFYPLDRSITASEIQNFRQYGTGATPKTLLTEISRTMNRIVHSQAKLREKCLAYAIQGIGLNEGGVSTDSSYFTKFSATQTETLPSSGSTMPAIHFNVRLLPLPEAPKIPR